MDTTTAPFTARGIALLATHPDLLVGAYSVTVYEHELRIQGHLIDMCDAMLALHNLDPTAHVDHVHVDDDGAAYKNVVGRVDGIDVELVLVTLTAQREAVNA